MMDVLAFLAYNSTPLDRERRAQILMEEMRKECTEQQKEFVDYIMQLYVQNGFKELGEDKLPTLINMKYKTPFDAVNKLHMQPNQIRDFYLDMQQQLYNGKAVVNFNIQNHFNGPIGTVQNIN